MPTFTLDREQPVTVEPLWSFGANTCHAPLWFREDLQGHLKRLRSECGFRYIRAHGTIGDAMLAKDPSGYGFEGVCDGLQKLLDLGFKPFVEISHMPLLLASGDAAITRYKFRSSPPESYDKWEQFIDGFVAALIKRFGLPELRTWYFEVWNEPDLAFWDGDQAAYFKLYDRTARALKRADSALRVGGPATARTNWIDEFLAHLATPSEDYGLETPRCDFIATHAYPSDVAFLDQAHGAVTLQNSTIMAGLFTQVRRKVDAAMGPGVPVICGEWNSSAGPLASNHDEANNAAFIVKTMHELSAVCQGSLYWNASDIYEECGFHHEPFHGGYGLLTVNDIPKAAFHGFAMLHQLEAGSFVHCELEDVPDGVGALASVEGDTARALIYYYREPDAQAAQPVSLRLRGLPGATAQVQVVKPGAGSAYEAWIERGRPSYATRELLEYLEAASEPATASIWTASEALTLEPGTLVMLTSTRT